MCGIAGFLRFAGLRSEERGLGPMMAATLRHRGPDEAGGYTDGLVSLGHTRLSIIDLCAGRQPMSNEDGSVWVVFNGEIYNHAELTTRLRSRGHQLRTLCDTEVLVHLYEDLGEEFVHQLNGMFAIAVWDTRRRQLLLVRDRLGIKPLYWHDDGGRIAFGSELKAVLAAEDLRPHVDLHALVDYLTFGHVPAPRTIFQGIRKLEPGHLAVCTAAGTRVRQYWDIPLKRGEGAKSGPHAASCEHEFAQPGAATEEFAALLQNSVAIRTLADVPLGAFLSGGVDSASVVAGMCRSRDAGSEAVLTHTVGFSERDHDERAAAREVANLLGTDHREVMVRPDAAAAAELLARHFDEPFADSSAVPTYYLSKAARERVTVALAGDGADELLGGYRRYWFDLAEGAAREHLPEWLLATAGLAGAVYPKADWLPRSLRAKVTLQNLACDAVTAHLRSVSLRSGALPGFLLRPEVLDSVAEYDPFERPRGLLARRGDVGAGSALRLSELLYLDMKTLLPDDMLTKVDRASMAVGLEVREPLLDYRLVEFAARLPAEQRLEKRILRETLGGWLGPQFAQRPKKGFNVPVDAWFRGPLRQLSHDLLDCPAAACAEWIAPEAIRRVLRDHERGVRNDGHVLWTLLSLELWARAYVPARVKATAEPARQLAPA
jgi:asparagine synthase (glutamine-hydrolysing)